MVGKVGKGREKKRDDDKRRIWGYESWFGAVIQNAHYQQTRLFGDKGRDPNILPPPIFRHPLSLGNYSFHFFHAFSHTLIAYPAYH